MPLCVLIGLLVRRLAKGVRWTRRRRDLEPGTRSLAERTGAQAS